MKELEKIQETINKLKEENKALRKRFEELVSDLGWHCVQCIKEAENCMLRIENEKLKTQYNCYACGNCKGKEDYINLEKHHIGLRKQFDKYHNALQDIKNLVTTDYIQIKKQLIQNYDCLDNFMQKIEDKCNEVNQ